MYIGRYLVVDADRMGYRVSSRSFPARTITAGEDGYHVVPTADAEETTNPYVSYTCLRAVDGAIVGGNGSHVDTVAEKLARGYPPRDALALALLAYDYEADAYRTPRIAAIVDGTARVGIVTDRRIQVEPVEEPTLVATYERTRPTPVDPLPASATAIADGLMAAPYEHAVCAVGAVTDGDEVTAATDDAA